MGERLLVSHDGAVAPQIALFISVSFTCKLSFTRLLRRQIRGSRRAFRFR